MVRALIPFCLLMTTLACSAVPDIAFGYNDGATVDDTGDATSDQQAQVDAGEAGSATCPNAVPSYATMCCGPVACSGPNCVATCLDCAKCSALDLCCPNAQNRAVCKPLQHC